MKIVIKEKVIPYILISLFSFIGLSAYGYKAERQGGSKAVVWSISKIDTMHKNVQRNDGRNPNIQNIEYLKKMFRQKAVDEISENIVYPLKRTSPIPSVENAEELKERFDSIFDEDLIRIITSSDIDQWSEMGWRGIMLDDGILWMDYDGKITAVNYQSKYEKISGITSKNGRNDAKRLNIRVVTVSNDDKPKNRKTQRKADLRRRMVCKSLPVKE